MDKQVTKEQIGSIVALLVAGKVPFEDAQAFIDRYKSMPKTKKREKKPAPIPEDHYSIEVRDIADPTIKSLDQFYACVNECWDTPGDGIQTHSSLRALQPTPGKEIVFLKRFETPVTMNQVVSWAMKNGYRLAFPCEREAFAHSHLKRLFDRFGADKIIDLGTSTKGKQQYVPMLEGDFVPVLRWTAKLGAYMLNNDPFGTEFSFLLIKLD